MVEYVLLAGVNDTEECALQLGRLMGPRSADVMVNLIPYNPSEEGTFKAPAHSVVERFQNLIAAFGVTCRVRKEMGRDIAGACGQLALNSKGGQKSGDVEDYANWRKKLTPDVQVALKNDSLATVAAASKTGPGAGDKSEKPSAPTDRKGSISRSLTSD